MKKQTVLTVAAFVIAAGMSGGCVYLYNTNLNNEKALTAAQMELETAQGELETAQAELETARAEYTSLQEKLAQAEQSHQGAANKTQLQAPSGQAAIEAGLNEQLPGQPDKDYSGMSANDLLIEALGDQGNTSNGNNSNNNANQGTYIPPAVGEKDAWGNTYLGEPDPNYNFYDNVSPETLDLFRK